MTGLMSEQFLRKFEDKPKLPTRTLPEIRKALDAVVTRHRHDDSYRAKDEPFNGQAIVNAVLAWFCTQTEEEQDRIAQEGINLCNERLRSGVEIPLHASPAPKARKPKG